MGHPQGFIGPRSPQTEPVDFSGPPRPLGFGLVGPPGHYSRESTPDSGGSHYIESYRDPSGKSTFFFMFYKKNQRKIVLCKKI